MRRLLLHLRDQYLNEKLDFRAQIFNLLALLGMFLGLFLAGFSAFLGAGIGNVLGNLGAATLAAALIRVANRTGRFRQCFLITVVVVFLGLFPVLFFTGGGYHSGMPSFFVFGVVVTVLMLEGRRRTVLTIAEVALYLACCLTAYHVPQTVRFFPAEAAMAMDIIGGCLLASCALAVAISWHLAVYDRKQRELEKAVHALEGLDRMKTEFLQDMSHEMQNPLTVISVGLDFVRYRMGVEGGAAEAHAALDTVQEEVLRLGRMVGSMVRLAAMDGGPEGRARLDFSAMLRRCAESFRLNLEKKGNTLRVEIPPDLPHVYGEGDRLTQVLTNLLSNAAGHTENGLVILSACHGGGFLTVRVRDTGDGVPPELLPRVFQRGVTGGDGAGYGLAISKTIVEAHGGDIAIQNRRDGGAEISFTLPVYGGQSEVRGNE